MYVLRSPRLRCSFAHTPSPLHLFVEKQQLALPPSKFVDVSKMLKKHNYSKEKSNRIVIEKPFGKDTDSCEKMMSQILADWDEKEIYRIDHFLGDDTCRLLLQLR